jgi:hypothetical protein
MKIGFADFWPSPRPFDPCNNFFVHALRSCVHGLEVVRPENCDVLFYGPFGDQHRRFRDCLKIFYTGENILPNFDECHAALSFSPEAYGGKNLRLPLWHLYIDWFGVKSYGNPEWLVPQDWLIKPRLSPFWSRDKRRFCAIVYGKPIESRIRAIKALSDYRPVDIFGKANALVPIADGEWAKLEIRADYRFSLCYENSIAPGYHTEKLLHGKICGGIPIYYGHESIGLDFNPRCCIQAAFMDPEELINQIREIDESPLLYRQIVEEPLFERLPDLSQICEGLYQLINASPPSPLVCNRVIPFELARIKRLRKGLWAKVKSVLRRCISSFYFAIC